VADLSLRGFLTLLSQLKRVIKLIANQYTNITPQLQLGYNTDSRLFVVAFLHHEKVMALARLPRSTRCCSTWNYLGRLMSAAILAITLFTVYTTFLRRNEYLTTRSDLVRNQLETVSNERLKKYTRDQRGKEPNALRF